MVIAAYGQSKFSPSGDFLNKSASLAEKQLSIVKKSVASRITVKQMKKHSTEFQVLYRMCSLAAALVLTAVTGFSQTGRPVGEEPEPTNPATLTADKEESRAALSARLNSPDVTAEKRAKLLAELEARREALMDEYLDEYRKTILETHKLYPEDPWLAMEKIQAALQARLPLIEQHNHLADLLDQHAPVTRPDTGPQLRSHLARLPTAEREYIEAVQASLETPATSFESIASAQMQLQTEAAKDPDYAPKTGIRPIRDSPRRQAHLRRLHGSMLETDPGNTPPLAAFLHSQRISLFNEAFDTNSEKP